MSNQYFTEKEARKIGDKLNINWNEININEFTQEKRKAHSFRSGMDSVFI